MVIRSGIALLMLLTSGCLVDNTMKELPEGELRQEKANDQSPAIKCTIRTDNVIWHSEDAGVTVTVELQSQATNDVSLMPSLHMSGLPKKQGLDQIEYWAPFAIPSGASTKETQKLSPANESSARYVRLVPGHLLWASTKSSVWPSQAFAKLVPPGDYNLQAQLEIKGGKTISSNEVTITVLK